MTRLKPDVIGVKTQETEGEDYPHLDLLETPDNIIAEIDVPGIPADDLSLKYLDGTLIIEGRKREEPHKGRVRYLCMERSFERFRRLLKLPVTVDAGNVHARLHGGVLTVTFAKVNEKRGRTIKIQIE